MRPFTCHMDRMHCLPPHCQPHPEITSFFESLGISSDDAHTYTNTLEAEGFETLADITRIQEPDYKDLNFKMKHRKLIIERLKAQSATPSADAPRRDIPHGADMDDYIMRVAAHTMPPRVFKVFLSLRFSEAMQAAEMLKRYLEARGISCFLCDVQPGGDIGTTIAHAIHDCQLVVIFGTATYGRKTESSFSTFEELKYVKDYNKPFFLIKMCSEFEEPTTKFYLPPSVSYYQWSGQVDDALVRAVETKFRSVV